MNEIKSKTGEKKIATAEHKDVYRNKSRLRKVHRSLYSAHLAVL